MLGDAFALVALPLLVLELTGSVAKMGLLTAATGAVQIAMGLSAGWIMDRFDRRQIMILCDVGRAILFALVPFWGATIGPSMALVYTVTVLAAALAGLFAVGCVTAIPNLVNPERVTEANGRLTASQGVCFVLGPALAGLVCARFGPATAVGMNALSFLASALSLAAIRIGRGRADPFAAAAHRGGGGALDGVRFVLRHPVLRAAVLCFSVLGILGAGVVDRLIFLLKRGRNEGDGALGLVLSLGAAGAALGGLSTAPVRRRFGFGASFIGASALEAVAVAGVGLSPATYVAMASR
jgi:MFS family permease